MVWSKLLKCFPGRRRQKAKEADSESSDENDAFNSKQKAKAVAVVLSGYDTEIAAASIGPPCDADTVERWVKLYRPPFFEDGMKCPPALISWWMNELEREDTEFMDTGEDIVTASADPSGSPASAGTNEVLEGAAQQDHSLPSPPPAQPVEVYLPTSSDSVSSGPNNNQVPELNTSVAAEIISSG